MPLVKALKIEKKKKESLAIAKDRLVEKRESCRKTWANDSTTTRLRKPVHGLAILES